MEVLKYTIFKTRWGWSALVGNESGLLSFILPGRKREILTRIRRRFPDSPLIFDSQFLKETASKVILYFEGERIIFNERFQLIKSTPFQRRVFKSTQRIPYGKTISYTALAMRLKTSARAVGQALKRNPLPIIIPCHRVIGKNGCLVGYSEGLDWKKKLLSLEKENA